MHTWWARASLAAVVGLGVTAGLLRAGEYATVPYNYPAPVPPGVPNLPPGMSLYPGPMPPVFAMPEPPQPPPTRGQAIKGWLQRHNLCCWSHHNNAGCGSLASEWNFVFGSCRNFYSEPCFGGPAAPLMSPANGPAQPNGMHLGGCRCP